MKEVFRLKPVSWLGRIGLLLLLCVQLSACSFLEGRKVDYESAARGKPLVVPPDLTQLPRDARYTPAPAAAVAGTTPSPESSDKGKKEEPLSTPPDLTKLPQDTRYTVPGASVVSATGAAQGAHASAAASVTLEQREGGNVLVVGESFDRAWRRVGLTLDRTGFTVEDRDRNAGLYYVRYVEPPKPGEEPPGFFKRLFTGEKAKDRTPRQYRIKVEADSSRTQTSLVAVLAPEGGATAAPEPEHVQRILQVIADDLR